MHQESMSKQQRHINVQYAQLRRWSQEHIRLRRRNLRPSIMKSESTWLNKGRCWNALWYPKLCLLWNYFPASVHRERRSHESPSSSCLHEFVKGWTRPFGWPKLIALDRGTHNREVFMQTMTRKGVRIRPAGLDSPEQIGRVERRNQTLKTMLHRVIKETHAKGRQEVDMALAECIAAINDMSRHGGYAPVQWVLAKFPRQLANQGDEDEIFDIGSIQAHEDAPTSFALQAKYREEARQAFIKWDCASRVRRGILSNATPAAGPYKEGRAQVKLVYNGLLVHVW